MYTPPSGPGSGRSGFSLFISTFIGRLIVSLSLSLLLVSFSFPLIWLRLLIHLFGSSTGLEFNACTVNTLYWIHCIDLCFYGGPLSLPLSLSASIGRVSNVGRCQFKPVSLKHCWYWKQRFSATQKERGRETSNRRRFPMLNQHCWYLNLSYLVGNKKLTALPFLCQTLRSITQLVQLPVNHREAKLEFRFIKYRSIIRPE